MSCLLLIFAASLAVIYERQYLDLVQTHNGKPSWKSEPEQAPEPSVFLVIRCGLICKRAFPWLLTVSCYLKRASFYELLWFLKGDTTWPTTWKKKCAFWIWDEWADEDGDLGPVYWKRRRSWQGNNGRSRLDQIAACCNTAKQIRIPEESWANASGNVAVGWNGDSLHHATQCFNFTKLEGKLIVPVVTRQVLLMYFGNAACRRCLRCSPWWWLRCVRVEAGPFVHTFGVTHLYLQPSGSGRVCNCRENQAPA